jgi:hypothetical protein
MTVEQIIAMIQERIESANHNDRQACENFVHSRNDAARSIAYTMQQMAAAQRLVLIDLLNEIEEAGE